MPANIIQQNEQQARSTQAATSRETKTTTTPSERKADKRCVSDYTRTCACLLGSNLRRQPICCWLVWIMPAHTKFSGLGSMPSSSCMPKPISLVRMAVMSNGCVALKIFWDLCWFLLMKSFDVNPPIAKQVFWRIILTLRDSSTGQRRSRQSFQLVQRIY